MKLSTLLEATEYFKLYKSNNKPLNEAYKGGMFNRYHKQIHDYHIANDEADTLCNTTHTTGYDFRYSLTDKYLLPSIYRILQYNPDFETRKEKIKELLSNSEEIYREYSSYSHLKDIEEVKKFAKNINRNYLEFYELVRMVSDEESYDYFNISEVAPEDVEEITFEETRLKKYNKHLMFWEDNYGKLVAMSIGPKIVFLIDPNKSKQNFLVDYLNPECYFDECISDDKLTRIFDAYDKNGQSYSVNSDIKDDILCWVGGTLRYTPKFYKSFIFNSSDMFIIGEKSVKKYLNTTTTKVFTDNINYRGTLPGHINNPVKVYAIDPMVVAKHNNKQQAEARRINRQDYINKYDTIDERMQDLEVMKARFEVLKRSIAQTKEYYQLSIKADDLFEQISERQEALYDFYTYIIQYPDSPEGKFMNIKHDSDYYNGRYNDTLVSTTLVSLFGRFANIQSCILSIMSSINELSDKRILQVIRKDQNAFKTIIENIDSQRKEINNMIDGLKQDVNTERYYWRSKEFKEALKGLFAYDEKYRELFDFSKFQI